MFNIASVINVRLTELFHWYGDRRHVEGDERFAYFNTWKMVLSRVT